MALGAGPVASAVIIPEAVTDVPPNNYKHRKSTSSSTPPSKRARLSVTSRHEDSQNYDSSHVPYVVKSFTDSPGPASAEVEDKNAKPDRHQPSALEERKRGRRLFGGLLSTLSQSGSNGMMQKRRSDIEKRQTERARLQEENDEVKRQEDFELLCHKRRQEQVKFDTKSMHIRHRNELAKSHFLQTDSKPHIYYKPWKLLPSQAISIQAQIPDIEAVLKRELDEWNSSHAKTLVSKSEEQKQPSGADQSGTTIETQREQRQNPSKEPSLPQSRSASNSKISIEDLVSVGSMNRADDVAPQNQDSGVTANPDDHEHNGEVVLEAEEDTVIY